MCPRPHLSLLLDAAADSTGRNSEGWMDGWIEKWAREGRLLQSYSPTDCMRDATAHDQQSAPTADANGWTVRNLATLFSYPNLRIRASGGISRKKWGKEVAGGSPLLAASTTFIHLFSKIPPWPPLPSPPLLPANLSPSRSPFDQHVYCRTSRDSACKEGREGELRAGAAAAVGSGWRISRTNQHIAKGG